MNKVTEIVSNIANSVQVIVDVLISLVFQPVFAVLTIVQSLIEIWSATDETEEEETEQQVTQFPSTNVGRYPDEVELPVCNHIGFKINREEQDEINKIKRQLNNGE